MCPNQQISPHQLIAAITAIAAALAEGREADEVAVMGTVFTQLGGYSVNNCPAKKPV